MMVSNQIRSNTILNIERYIAVISIEIAAFLCSEKENFMEKNNRIQNVEKPAQENDMVPEVCTQGKASNKAKSD